VGLGGRLKKVFCMTRVEPLVNNEMRLSVTKQIIIVGKSNLSWKKMLKRIFFAFIVTWKFFLTAIYLPTCHLKQCFLSGMSSTQSPTISGNTVCVYFSFFLSHFFYLHFFSGILLWKWSEMKKLIRFEFLGEQIPTSSGREWGTSTFYNYLNNYL